MPATTFALTGDNRMEAGATYDLTIPLVDSNGDPVDLTDYDPNGTGAGARMKMRKTIDETSTEVLDLTAQLAPLLEGVYIVEPPTLGKVRIYIEANTLAELSFFSGAALPDNRVGVFDVEVDDGEATPGVMRVLEGPYLIDPEATR